jgi:hypothetical protein
MITPDDFSAGPSPRGGVVCCGRNFPSDAAARAWLAEAIPRRAKMLGIPPDEMTTRQFFGDDRKREKMTPRQDVERQNWTIPAAGLDPERDKFGDMRAGDGEAAKPGSRKRKKIAQDTAREQYEERMAREAGPGDEVLKLRQWADNLHEQLLMSDASEYELERAAFLRRWANSDGADLSEFKSAAREFSKMLSEKRDTKAAEIQARRAALEKELASLPAAPTAPGDTPGVPAGGEVRKLKNAETGAVTFDVVGPADEAGARPLIASYNESSVPADVAAAAI